MSYLAQSGITNGRERRVRHSRFFWGFLIKQGMHNLSNYFESGKKMQLSEQSIKQQEETRALMIEAPLHFVGFIKRALDIQNR